MENKVNTKVGKLIKELLDMVTQRDEWKLEVPDQERIHKLRLTNTMFEHPFEVSVYPGGYILQNLKERIRVNVKKAASVLAQADLQVEEFRKRR